MEAAQLRGHRVLATTAAGLGFTGGHAMALIRPVRLHPAVLHEGRWLADPQWFTLGPAERYRLNDAAVIFMRTDPPVDAQYLRATYLLDLVDATRTLMINCRRRAGRATRSCSRCGRPRSGRPRW